MGNAISWWLEFKHSKVEVTNASYGFHLGKDGITYHLVESPSSPLLPLQINSDLLTWVKNMWLDSPFLLSALQTLLAL